MASTWTGRETGQPNEPQEAKTFTGPSASSADASQVSDDVLGADLSGADHADASRQADKPAAAPGDDQSDEKDRLRLDPTTSREATSSRLEDMAPVKQIGAGAKPATVGHDSSPISEAPAKTGTTAKDHPLPSMESRKRLTERTDRFLEEQMRAALRAMNTRIQMNTAIQAYFYAVAVAALGLVLFMLYNEVRPLGDLSAISIVSTTFPFLVAFTSTMLCVALALLIQGRSSAHFNNSLEQVSRMRREGTTSNTRAMALTQILEETLANARQAFSMQLWISRVLFIVGIVLVFAFVLSLFGNNPWVSTGSIVTSILALAAAALFNPQRQIGSDLANVTQLEAILGGYIRQATMLEEHIHQVMEACAERGRPDEANESVLAGVDRLSKVLATAVKSIDNQVHGADRMTDRETWLLRRLAEGAEDDLAARLAGDGKGVSPPSQTSSGQTATM
jgi:hypothetical protein